jgi:hypothetical protein
MNFFATNAGRPSCEKDDCTVRALAVVTGDAYAKAHALIGSWGRKSGHSFNVTDRIGDLPGFRSLRLWYARLPYVLDNGQKGFSGRNLTLAEFAKRHPVGRFYLCTLDHAFALIDGAVHDLRAGLVDDESELHGAWLVCR